MVFTADSGCPQTEFKHLPLNCLNLPFIFTQSVKESINTFSISLRNYGHTSSYSSDTKRISPDETPLPLRSTIRLQFAFPEAPDMVHTQPTNVVFPDRLPFWPYQSHSHLRHTRNN